MKKTDQHQITMVSLEHLVPHNHIYRKYHSLINFRHLTTDLRKKFKNKGAEGYGITTLFMCLLLQFIEDLIDRQLERFLQENTAAKYFCGFGLIDRTPDYSLFSKARKRIGTDCLSTLLLKVRKYLQKQGYINEVFNFVDASHLVAKSSLWKERDQAIKAKYERLNNEVLPKVCVDKDARIGCKGKDKYWYGYKKHVSVDMQSGLINKVAVTAANMTDAKGLKHVCPGRGVIFADKGYCTKDAQRIIKARGCEDGSVKKHNMQGKNHDLDRWRTKMRAPYERVFSKTNHRVRYRGLVKNLFTVMMESFCFNMKRLIVLDAPPLALG